MRSAGEIGMMDDCFFFYLFILCCINNWVISDIDDC